MSKAAGSRMNVSVCVVLVALISTSLFAHVSSYIILLIPLPGKSHILSMAAIAEGLADRGHSVSFLAGSGFRLSGAALTNRSEISIVRYDDSFDRVPTDYDAFANNATRTTMDSGKQAGIFLLLQLPLVKKQ